MQSSLVESDNPKYWIHTIAEQEGESRADTGHSKKRKRSKSKTKYDNSTMEVTRQTYEMNEDLDDAMRGYDDLDDNGS